MPLLDVQCFRTALAAAITAGVPIRFDRKCTVAELNRWCDEFQANFASSPEQSNPELIQAIDRVAGTGSKIPPRFFAALKTFAATQSMTNVLDGLTVTGSAERQIRRALRWPFIYLAIVLLIAIAGLVFYVRHVEPSYSSLRTDLILSRFVRPVGGSSFLGWLPTFVLAISITFFVASIGLLLGGFRKLAMAIGGRRFVQSLETAAAMQTMALLDQGGIDSTIATEISCELTGADHSVRKILESASKDFSATKTVARNICDSNQLQTGQQWIVLANYHAAAANQKLGYLRVATPVVLLSTIGGTIGLGYALAIYGPLISLLRDLVTAGT